MVADHGDVCLVAGIGRKLFEGGRVVVARRGVVHGAERSWLGIAGMVGMPLTCTGRVLVKRRECLERL